MHCYKAKRSDVPRKRQFESSTIAMGLCIILHHVMKSHKKLTIFDYRNKKKSKNIDLFIIYSFISSNQGRIQTELIRNTDSFYAVASIQSRLGFHANQTALVFAWNSFRRLQPGCFDLHPTVIDVFSAA